MHKIKQEFIIKVDGKVQFKELCSMLQTNIGPSSDATWKFRKMLASGEKNTGKRTRIRKPLENGGQVDLVVEVYADNANITNEDFLAIRLKY